jgi:hypothetical protein
VIYAESTRIKVKEGETFTIKGLGDIHHLLKESDEGRLIQDLTTRTTEKTLFIDLGDNLDSIGGAAHKYFSPMRVKDRMFARLDEQKNPMPLLNAELEDLCDLFSQYTKPSEWIGHCSGNHPLMQMINGIDLCQAMCLRLKHTYLGYQAYVPIDIQMSGNHRFQIMLFVSHGFGGGRTEGAAVNAYVNHAASYAGWDIAMYGHRHQKWIMPFVRMNPYQNQKTGRKWVKEEQTLICQTGTYLRTLSKTVYPTYAEKGGMKPRPIGCISIPITIRREKMDDGTISFRMKYEGME